MSVAYALLDESQKHSSWLNPFPTNLGRCIEEIPFQSVIISFRFAISSLLSLLSHSFSFSHSSRRKSFILRVLTSVIMPRRSKIEAKVTRTSRFIFACLIFSSFFIDVENSSALVFQIIPSTFVTLSFILTSGLVCSS